MRCSARVVQVAIVLGALVIGAVAFPSNVLVPTVQALSPYPSIDRDLNIVFEEGVRWADVERIVRAHGGAALEEVAYQDTYRNPERIGAGKKSVVFSLRLRSASGTLTSEEADAVRDRIVKELEKQLGGALRT